MQLTQFRDLNSRTARPIALTQLDYGAASQGNLYREMSDTDAQATLQAAWDAGIRYFDTAPQYGLGRSEARLGNALQGFNRNALVLSSKASHLLLDCAPDEVTPEAFVAVPQKRIVFNYTYDGIMRSFDDSVGRLGTDRIDILLLHDIDADMHGILGVEQKLRELFDQGGYRALTDLRAEGRITGIGAGVNTWQICERLLQEADFDGFLLAGRYTLLEQDPLDSFLPLCIAKDVGIILGGPYNSGILATGAIPGTRYNYIPAPPDILPKVKRISAVCAAHETDLITAALQFPLVHPAVKTVIPGAATPRRAPPQRPHFRNYSSTRALV
ncbi:aldo/keto reductase [Yoonia sp.]|uniref:aldo/keto reductase n=1 Tax=Yoonia sp. TaxID=2212373 RepID=UPI00391AF7A2